MSVEIMDLAQILAVVRRAPAACWDGGAPKDTQDVYTRHGAALLSKGQVGNWNEYIPLAESILKSRDSAISALKVEQERLSFENERMREVIADAKRASDPGPAPCQCVKSCGCLRAVGEALARI